MTNEEMQKIMEFILRQQATFTVNLDLLTEKVGHISDAQRRTEQNLAELAAAQTQMARQQEHMNEVVASMADSQQRTDEKLAALAEAQARTDRKLSETDERLNILIGVVERYFSEGRNGKSSD
jgi:3'-phosphoadenosine 5'-phosphosulfate (PAPS) 3'-phosphatase